MTARLSDALAALECEFVTAAERLSIQAGRRRRRTTLVAILVSSLIVLTGAAMASGLVHVPISPSDDPTENHAASALGLSAPEAAILLKAQRLGKIAIACQIAAGATLVNGGLDDPGGVAAAACKAENDANESYLDSEAFRLAMLSALPRLAEASRCFRAYTDPGSSADDEHSEVVKASRETIDAANAACYRPNGLPK